MGGSGRKGCTGACQPGGNPERGGVLRKDSIWDPAPHGHHGTLAPARGVCTLGKTAKQKLGCPAVPLSDPAGASQLL